MSQHYFDDEPSVPSRPRTITLAACGRTFELVTDRGVFAYGRLDPGTKVLLDTATWPRRSPLLDLGCGYGPISVALATAVPTADVWAVDVNSRARSLSAANAAAAGLTNVIVAHPDDVPPDLAFAAIWSNPPVRIGKAALDALVTTWLRRLRPDGTARLVVQRHLGADSLARRLTDAGWSVARVASRRGYRVLSVASDGADRPEAR